MKNKNVLIGILIGLIAILLAWNIYSTNRYNNLLKGYKFQKQYQNDQTKGGEDQPNPGDFEFEVPTGPFLNAENDIKPELLHNTNEPLGVKVISPNGGEEYMCGVGGTICSLTVKWSSTNLPKTSELFVALQKEGSRENIYLTNSTTNSGNETFTLPNDINILQSGNYKILIGGTSARVAQDLSDEFFKITRIYPPMNN